MIVMCLFLIVLWYGIHEMFHYDSNVFVLCSQEEEEEIKLEINVLKKVSHTAVCLRLFELFLAHRFTTQV